jgi:hypothetical protein
MVSWSHSLVPSRSRPPVFSNTSPVPAVCKRVPPAPPCRCMPSKWSRIRSIILSCAAFSASNRTRSSGSNTNGCAVTVMGVHLPSVEVMVGVDVVDKNEVEVVTHMVGDADKEDKGPDDASLVHKEDAEVVMTDAAGDGEHEEDEDPGDGSPVDKEEDEKDDKVATNMAGGPCKTDHGAPIGTDAYEEDEDDEDVEDMAEYDMDEEDEDPGDGSRMDNEAEEDEDEDPTKSGNLLM